MGSVKREGFKHLRKEWHRVRDTNRGMIERCLALSLILELTYLCRLSPIEMLVASGAISVWGEGVIGDTKRL